jgi:hypothetical protein
VQLCVAEAWPVLLSGQTWEVCIGVHVLRKRRHTWCGQWRLPHQPGSAHLKTLLQPV